MRKPSPATIAKATAAARARLANQPQAMFAAIKSTTNTYSDFAVATVVNYAPGGTTVLFSSLCYIVLSGGVHAVTGYTPMLGGGYYKATPAMPATGWRRTTPRGSRKHTKPALRLV